MNRQILYVLISFVFAMLWQGQLSAQEYRSETRKGNKAFMDKGKYTDAITHYKAALKADSLYVPAIYNMAYVLHNDRRDPEKNAEKDSLALQYLDKLSEKIKGSEHEFDYYFNRGVICIDMKDWQGAVDAFKQCLIHTPGDMKALENYVYAKEHLPKDSPQQQQQQQNQQDQNDQNQDQQNDQNDQNNQNDQDKQKDKGDQDKKDQQKDDQNGDQNKNKDQKKDQQGQGGGQPNESKISPQAAQQMLQAIQAKEKQTQDKVNKKKAAAMQSKQKQKNW